MVRPRVDHALVSRGVIGVAMNEENSAARLPLRAVDAKKDAWFAQSIEETRRRHAEEAGSESGQCVHVLRGDE